MNQKLNFAFFGTPEVASETLEILKENRFLPSLIITAPDARAGRGMKLQESPAAIFAKENNIECLKLETFAGLEEKLEEAKHDLFIVVAYGKIMPENILNLPKLGSINVHYSLLPKYRGAAPVESAILNGETKTGVSIQKMVYKLDAGAILAQEKIKIEPDERAEELRTRLIKLGGELLVKLLNTSSAFGPSPQGGGWEGVEQDESQATYSKKIKKEDGLVDLNDDPVKNHNKFRAYAEWPRIYFFRDGKRIIITDAELKDGKFVIKKVIPESGKEVDWKN